MSKTNIPTILVVFGATGDLMKRKLAPALFNLWQGGNLPTRFSLIGFSRRPYSDEEFRKHIGNDFKDHGILIDQSKEFLKLAAYSRGNFQDLNDYKQLEKKISELDNSWGVCSNKLFYLAVPPEMYSDIANHLAGSGLTKPCNDKEGWTRIIVEKPFGKNAKTAEDLDAMFGKLFKEEQIYRIDHYLAKEMLQNILAFRFSNNLLENTWDKEAIEKIEIKVWEKIGVEERGSFYDGIGALRDVGQNHLLQMLSLVTMNHPIEFSPDAIRSKRAEILNTLNVPTREEVKRFGIRAQYDGYRSIVGVEKDSQTETYFKIKASLSSPRWEGVSVTMESGKRLGESRKEIMIYFKHPSPCLCAEGNHYRNKVVFALEPEEKIFIHFWSKKPGFTMEMEEKKFEFSLRDNNAKKQYVEEYEKLLLDSINGDQTLFVSTRELAAMWRFIDPFLEGWNKNKVPLHSYLPDDNKITELKFPAEESSKIIKEIGYIGLGKMGSAMTRRLLEHSWKVHVFDVDKEAATAMEKAGALSAENLRDFSSKLKLPRIIWLMLPAGKAVDEVLFGKDGLAEFCSPGDIIIDGGNSFFEDSTQRAEKLFKRGIHFLDAGISGGPAGARSGASVMVGGEQEIYEKVRVLFEDIAISEGYAHVGKSGAGHFVKMVHNGIEYGMMQSIAEGFNLLKKSPFKFDLQKIARVYNRGSVIQSRLIEWLGEAFKTFGDDLKDVSESVGYTGEGEWTVKTAKELGELAEIIKASVLFRKESNKKPSFTGKILSALRNRFGGHKVNKLK